MQKAYHWRIFTPANNQTIWPLQWWIIAPAFSADIPQVECPFLHVVDVLCPEQAACTTFAVVWAPDPGTERDFWSRQLG